MLTWSLQFATSLLFLAIGILGLAIARRLGPAGAYRHGWVLTGLAFTAHGANFVVQNLWGVAAMFAGRESGAMTAYLRFAPAFNHSRTFLLLGFCGLLIYLAARRDRLPGQFSLAAAGVLAAGLLVGCAIGVSEGSIVGAHFSIVARWDAVELLLLLGTLFYALLRNAMDRYNWGLLAIYGFMLALNVVSLAALAFIQTPGAWSPSPRYVHIYRLALLAVMLGVTVRRYLLARRGERVPGLMDFGAPPPRLGLV